MAWTKTKTAIVIGVGVMIAAGSFVAVKKIGRVRQQRQQARIADLKTNKWPEERKVEAERIKSRQQSDETVNAITISLSPHINTRLTEAPSGWKGNNDDNLSEVPSGRNIFAGVPFEVSGSIQLMGGWMKHYHKTYPASATGIRIERNCTRLHLLHGDSYVAQTNLGTVVAKLVIHYADGTSHDFEMIAGKHCFDWWAPLMKTGVPQQYFETAPGTERAWTGSNPYIRKWQPELSLVLYKTTLENPHPDVKISSVDYISTETITCPFLVGLTVE